MERKKGKRKGILERAREGLIRREMPERPLAGYRIEMQGQGACARVLVSGARRILTCESEQVVLEIRERRLVFCGEGLECLCYEGGIAEICGDVKEFSFLGTHVK